MFIHNPLSGRGGSKDCNNRFSLALAQQPGHLPLLLDNPPPSWKGPGWQRTCSYWLPLTTTEFIWRASGKPSYLYFSWLRSRVCIRAGSFGKDITRSSEGRERMLAWAAQSSLALSRMTSSPARLPSWLSVCRRRVPEQVSDAHRRPILCSRPEETCNFLKGQRDPLFDPAMPLALEGHARCDPCFMSIHKHTPQCVPQFTLEIQFLFPKHLFFLSGWPK